MAPAAGPERRTVRDVPVAATVCLVAIGLLFTAVAVVYFAEPAHDLPGLIPGSDKSVMRHHVKHGLLSLGLGLAALFVAVSSAGRRPAPGVGEPLDGEPVTVGPPAQPGQSDHTVRPPAGDDGRTGPQPVEI